MAIQLIAGFDEETVVAKVFDNAPNPISIVIDATASRSGLGMGCVNKNDDAGWNLSSAQGTVVVGGAVQVKGTPNGNALLTFRDAGGTQCVVCPQSDGSLIVKRDPYTTITPTSGSTASGPSVFIFGNWFYLEARITIGLGGAGAWAIRVNGVTVCAGTGPTQSSGLTAAITRVLLGAGTAALGGNDTLWDDVYVLDGRDGTTLGEPAANNDFWGDTEILLATPTANGYRNDGVGTGSTAPGTQWQNVDEVPTNTADYNTLATVGDIESYVTNLLLSGSATVRCVAVSFDAAKTTVGPGTVAAGLRSAGTNAFGADISLTTAFARRLAVFAADPATGGAWTVPSVNAGIQALITVTS